MIIENLSFLKHNEQLWSKIHFMQKGNQPSKIKQGQTEICQGDVKEREGGRSCFSYLGGRLNPPHTPQFCP